MNDASNGHNYHDIIHLPHHTSCRHPRMSVSARAAQFSPFAAMTGYGDAVLETARLTERRIELDEYQKVELNERLWVLREHMNEQPEVSICYFQPDERKAGGAYQTLIGAVRKIDIYEHSIVMRDGQRILIEDVLKINGEIFGMI